jgi:undecaprenyl-diphosphatase
MLSKFENYFSRIIELDERMCIKINQVSQIEMVKILFRLISRLGDGIFWYVLMIFLLLSNEQDALAHVLQMIVAGLTGTILYKWLKRKTSRPRPYEVHSDIWLTGKPLDRFSFPSGHTLHAVAFTTVIGFYYPALMLAVLPFTLLVALSRVVLGLHYPTDVLIGALIGFLIAMGSLYLFNIFV